MNCRGIENWIWREGAGNMPADAVAHAAGCPACRKLVDEIRLLDRVVTGSVVPDPSSEYWDALCARIAARLDTPATHVAQLVPYVPTWRRTLVRMWAPALAAVLVAIVANQEMTVRTSSPDLADQLAALRDVPHARYDAGETSQLKPAGLELSKNDLDRPVPGSIDSRPGFREESARHNERAILQSGQTVDHAFASGSSPNLPTVSAMPSSAHSDVAESSDDVWPERQVTVVGKIDSSEPSQPVDDEKRLAAQDPFGAYERQMAFSSESLESTNAFAAPGRLLEGPASVPLGRGADRQTPAETMRRFDEMAELRQLISRIEAVPSGERAVSQWAQWSTAWYRLGMLTEQAAELDKALAAVIEYSKSQIADSAAVAEWGVRKNQLQSRRSQMNP